MAIEHTNEGNARNLLKGDPNYGYKYMTPTAAFSVPLDGVLNGYRVDESQPYDTDSIMHYASGTFATDPARAMSVIDAAKIVKKIKDNAGNTRGFSTMPINMVPSAGDRAWVRRKYPYRGPRDNRGYGAEAIAWAWKVDGIQLQCQPITTLVRFLG
jgi:hypothetical protein